MSPEPSGFAKRMSLASRCALPMYACSAGYGGYVVFKDSSTPGSYLGIILGLPAIAMALMVILTATVPDLLAPQKLVFPLNITLPLVFSSLLLLTVLLLTSTGSSLIIAHDRLRVAMFWANPTVIFLVTLSQILCLTVLALFKAEPVDS